MHATKPKIEAGLATATLAFKTTEPFRTELAWGTGEDVSHLASISAEPGTEHRVTLDGLEPGHDYTFVVRYIVDGRLVSNKHETFKTKPREELDALNGRKSLVKEEVDLLLDALRSSDYRVRLQAAQAIGEAAPDATFDALVKLMRDQNNEVREAAHVALGRFVKRGAP